MAEITRRRTGELERGVCALLLQESNGLKAKEVLSRLERTVPPTPFELAEYPNKPGVRRFEKIVRFGSIPLVKAGWLVKTKGTWTLTDAGRAAFGQFTDPERFIVEAIRLYREWDQSRPTEDDTEVAQEASEVESAGRATTVEEAEEDAWNAIEQHLNNIGPYDFQDLVAALLRALGYHVSWIAPPGPDRGIDIIAHRDPLGIDGPQLKVQVKHRSDRASVPEIRSFLAVLSERDVGLFVSSGGFTKDAEEEARHQERRRITLINLERLFDLWVENYSTLEESARRLLPLKPVHFLDQEE